MPPHNYPPMDDKLGPERNIYGRYGKLFMVRVPDTATRGGPWRDPHAVDLAANQWIANTTAVKATAVYDKQEVKSAGDIIVRYKLGAFTGSGTLTIDKVNSRFEKFFIDHLKGAISGVTDYDMPMFHLTISLEDLGGSGASSVPGLNPNPGATSTPPDRDGLYDARGFAIYGHEAIILKGVQFWSIPLGYDTNEMVTQDLEFTFQGMAFGGDMKHPHMINDTYKFPVRIC